MAEIQLINTLGTSTWSIDVLFITNQQKIPLPTEKMLECTGLDWARLQPDRLSDELDELGNIGTVVVDTTEVEKKRREKFINALKKLEQSGTGIILLNNCIDFPFNRFRLACMLSSAAHQELWGRIESNIAYRKNTTADSDSQQTGPLIQQSDDLIDQLKMAGQVQQSFLPKTLPNNDKLRWATVFQPADWVSGDIYDIARLDEQHMGFYIADAVGHSMPAALLSIFLKQAMTMRQTIGNDYRIFSPMEVIKNLNTKMNQQNLGGCLFITCCYCLLNFKTMTLNYCRGGHPYPILIRKGQDLRQLETRGALLGVFDDAEFEQATVQLQPDDKIFLYSDGCEPLVGQSTDEGCFEFTKDFLNISRLPAEKMLEEFNTLVKNRNTPKEEIDDITAIALEIL